MYGFHTHLLTTKALHNTSHIISTAYGGVKYIIVVSKPRHDSMTPHMIAAAALLEFLSKNHV